MQYFRTGILLSIVVLGLEALLSGPVDHHGTLMCHECDDVKDPSECTSLINCHHGVHVCYTEVTYDSNGESWITKGCKHEPECYHHGIHVVGKRFMERRAEYTVCRECCTSSQCNTNGCANYLAASTTIPTTLAPCRDHEGDDFTCTDYDPLNFCTDSSGFAHKLAYDRCPKHCGFCDSDGNYLDACVDKEYDGFVCADYDSYNFCTDTANLAHKLAIDRCPKHCGLCSSNGGAVVPTVSVAAVSTTTVPTTTTTTTTTSATTTTTVGTLCRDDEDSNFTCANWASYGFCLNIPGSGHDVAVKRCSKYCGLCS